IDWAGPSVPLAAEPLCPRVTQRQRRGISPQEQTMKKTLFLLPALITLGLTACAPTDVTSSPDEQPATAPQTQETQGKQAKIGDTITLKGSESELKLAVTVVKFAQSAKSKDEYSGPEPGERFAAVQITLKNVGSI